MDSSTVKGEEQVEIWWPLNAIVWQPHSHPTGCAGSMSRQHTSVNPKGETNIEGCSPQREYGEKATMQAARELLV